MLNSIKNYFLAGLAVLTSILAALWQYQRAAFKSAKLKGERAARKTEKKAVDAMIEGLENEQKEVEDAKNSTDRTHFN